jgi:hypothetical protein
MKGLMKLLRRAALLLAALTLAAPAAAQAKYEAAFTRDMAARFGAALPGRTLTITGALEISAGETEDYESLTINVGRIFNFCATATPQECEASRTHYVAEVAGALTEQTAPITREQLRVIVRHTDFCRDLERTDRPQLLQAIHRAVPAPGLCAVLMADYPTRMRSVGEEDLAALGLDPGAAWALAVQQTLAGLPDPGAIELTGGNLVAITEMDYVPSLLLAGDGWRRLARGGEIVVAVPSDGLMLVSRRAVLQPIEGFRTAVREDFETAERGISPLLYRWTEAGWVVVE